MKLGVFIKSLHFLWALSWSNPHCLLCPITITSTKLCLKSWVWWALSPKSPLFWGAPCHVVDLVAVVIDLWLMSSCYWLRFLWGESCRFHLVKLTWRYCHLDQPQISWELQLQLTYSNIPRWSQLSDEEDNCLQSKYSVNNAPIVLLMVMTRQQQPGLI